MTVKQRRKKNKKLSSGLSRGTKKKSSSPFPAIVIE